MFLSVSLKYADFTAVLIKCFTNNKRYDNRSVKLKEIIRLISKYRFYGIFQASVLVVVQQLCNKCNILNFITLCRFGGRVFLVIWKFQIKNIWHFNLLTLKNISIYIWSNFNSAFIDYSFITDFILIWKWCDPVIRKFLSVRIMHHSIIKTLVQHVIFSHKIYNGRTVFFVPTSNKPHIVMYGKSCS